MESLVNGAARRIDITSLVVAGWTGRDPAAGERFEIDLHDTLKERSLKHQYAIRALAIAD